MDNFLFNNANMSNGYPSQQRRVRVPTHQQSQYPYQQLQYQNQRLQYPLQQVQYPYQQVQYPYQQLQCQYQHPVQQYQPSQQRQHPWQQFQQLQNPYQQLPFQHQQPGFQYQNLQFQYQQQQSQNCQQLYQQQCGQHSQYHQESQYQQYQQYQQQQYQYPQQDSVDYLTQLTDLTNLGYVDAEPVQYPNADILPIQREPEPLQPELQQRDFLPVQQQPISNILIGTTQDAPIEIDDEVEELTEESTPTPISQQGQPTTPQLQETPCPPVPKKPENSFFTEFHGKPDKNGKIKRPSIECILRKNNVRMSALRGLTGAERAERMFKEDLARATKLAKQRKAKELGLANPVEDEELMDVEAVLEKERTPASLKRKSADIDNEDSLNTEPASKAIRIETEQEQIAAPITQAAAPVVLPPDNEDELAKVDEAFLIDEETAPEYGDLEIDETSVPNEIHISPALPSLEVVFEARRVSGKAKGVLPHRDTHEVSVVEEEEEEEEEEEKNEAASRARLEAEAYNARIAAELEAELEAEFDEEDEIERPRSPSVSSDEDEGDDFIGNLKYKRN